MRHKTIAISKDTPDLSKYRAHVLHDHESGLHYAIHWPRNLQEQLAFEAEPGLTHLPCVEDQMTTVSQEVVDLLPSEIGVTTTHNTYQTLTRLHRHYQWPLFHPHN